MVNAGELRRGNKVSERDNHRVYDVLEILSNGVRVKYWSCGESEVIPYNRLMPVPLTKEVIDALDFDFNDVPEKLSLFIRDGILFIEKDSFGEVALPHLNSVHMMQNFYYYLTGKELVITFNNLQPA